MMIGDVMTVMAVGVATFIWKRKGGNVIIQSAHFWGEGGSVIGGALDTDTAAELFIEAGGVPCHVRLLSERGNSRTDRNKGLSRT